MGSIIDKSIMDRAEWLKRKIVQAGRGLNESTIEQAAAQYWSGDLRLAAAVADAAINIK